MKEKKGSLKRHRTARRQSNTRGDEYEERREALARELIHVCMQGLSMFGLDRRRLATIVAQAATGRVNRRIKASEVLTDADRLGRLVSKWSEEPAYRDLTGRPAILATRNTKGIGFAKLVREFFPGWEVAEVVTLGCDAAVFERVGTHKLALLSNCVLYPDNAGLLLAAAVRSVRRVFRATDVNGRLRSAIAESWPDRAVRVEVSEDDFRKFVAFIRPQISALTEISNRWLVRHAALATNRGKKKRGSGLQVFVYRE